MPRNSNPNKLNEVNLLILKQFTKVLGYKGCTNRRYNRFNERGIERFARFALTNLRLQLTFNWKFSL